MERIPLRPGTTVAIWLPDGTEYIDVAPLEYDDNGTTRQFWHAATNTLVTTPIDAVRVAVWHDNRSIW